LKLSSGPSLTPHLIVWPYPLSLPCLLLLPAVSFLLTTAQSSSPSSSLSPLAICLLFLHLQNAINPNYTPRLFLVPVKWLALRVTSCTCCILEPGYAPGTLCQYHGLWLFGMLSGQQERQTSPWSTGAP
jgi:hypothetical protein